MDRGIVITAGDLYTDIDVLACSIALYELLLMEGKKAQVVLPGILNKSISKTIKTWSFNFKKSLRKEDVNFIIVDVSNPKVFSKFVKNNKVIEVYDHHDGFYEYWKKRIGKNAKIQTIGACATLIWEEYKRRNKESDISSVSANLLYTAIISNTLNLKASLTKKRDINALNEIVKYTKLPTNWIEKYFKEQEEELYKQPIKTIIGDTIILNFPNSKTKLVIGQLELWQSRNFITTHKCEIETALKTFKIKHWFLTSPSICEGVNYIFSKSNRVKNLLEEILKIKFINDIAKTSHLLLRKEIRKKFNQRKI